MDYQPYTTIEVRIMRSSKFWYGLSPLDHKQDNYYMLPLDCGVGYLPYTTVRSWLCVTSKFWRDLSLLDHKYGNDYMCYF